MTSFEYFAFLMAAIKKMAENVINVASIVRENAVKEAFNVGGIQADYPVIKQTSNGYSVIVTISDRLFIIGIDSVFQYDAENNLFIERIIFGERIHFDNKWKVHRYRIGYSDHGMSYSKGIERNVYRLKTILSPLPIEDE